MTCINTRILRYIKPQSAAGVQWPVCRIHCLISAFFLRPISNSLYVALNSKDHNSDVYGLGTTIWSLEHFAPIVDWTFSWSSSSHLQRLGSLAAASEEPPLKYFFRSNTSRSFCDDSRMTTRADHWTGERLPVERLPELKDCWISTTREQSFSSFRQWNRLMLFSAEELLTIFFLMYWTALWLVFDLLSVYFSRPLRRDWLVCS